MPLPSTEKNASLDVPLKSTSLILILVIYNKSVSFIENLPGPGFTPVLEDNLYAA